MWSLGLMLTLMFLAVPVAIALAVPSLVGVYAITGGSAASNIFATAPYNGVSSWSMSVLPMFIFMGMLLSQSGLAKKIYKSADHWFSWLPGGIGIGTTAAGAGLASVSGSTIGMTFALGRAGIPEMLRAGYDKRVAVGTVIVAGLPGGLIPPSILLIIYAGIASVPVGPQLLAGAIPGILLAVTFGLTLLALGLLAPKLVGRGSDSPHAPGAVSWRDRFASLLQIWGLPVIMVVLFGGLISGVFTPTEAGAAAALVALLLTLLHTRKDQPLSNVAQAAFSAVSSTATIFFLLIGAEMLTSLLAITNLAQMASDAIISLGLSRIGFLFVLVVFYLIMGLFFETISMMLLTIPVLIPTLHLMEIDLIWFGVFVVLLGELAMITPPVGILTYIVHNITQSPEVNLGNNITLKDVFSAVAMFAPVILVFLAVLIFFPQMTEWLPRLMR